MDVSHWPSDPPAIKYFLLRDGDFLAQVDGTQYVDEKTTHAKTHQYQVIALVNGFVSRPGNVVSVKVSRFPFMPPIENQTYTQGIPIEPLQLPAVQGGDPPFSLRLDGSVPPGLRHDWQNRRILGTPTQLGDFVLHYTAIETPNVGGNVSGRTFTITVVAPQLPGTALPLAPQVETRTLRENAPPGTAVGDAVTLTSTTPTNPTHTLLDYQDDDYFTIDAATGQLSTVAGHTYDYETKPLYVLAVQVCGPGDPEVCEPTIGVNVNLTDLPPPGPPQNLEVLLSDQSSLSLRWNAPDNTEPPGLPPILGYKLVYTSDDENGARHSFDVDLPATPTSTVVTGLAPETEYEFQIQACSVEGCGAFTETESRTTLRAHGPRFTSSAAFTVPENTTAVGTVVAVDEDEGDRILRYWLASFDDGRLFTIIEGTGQLAFKTAPDFEADPPVCGDGGNTCQVQVLALKRQRRTGIY